MSPLSDAAAYWQAVADYWKAVATTRADALDERDRLIATLRAACRTHVTTIGDLSAEVDTLRAQLAERTRDADAFHDEANEWRAKAQNLTDHVPSSLT